MNSSRRRREIAVTAAVLVGGLVLALSGVAGWPAAAPPPPSDPVETTLPPTTDVTPTTEATATTEAATTTEVTPTTVEDTASDPDEAPVTTVEPGDTAAEAVIEAATATLAPAITTSPPATAPTRSVSTTTTPETTTVAAVLAVAAAAGPVLPAPTCRVYAEVGLGSEGLAAHCVETRLVQLGYWLQGPDQVFDSTAVHALRIYQQRQGLPANGFAGRATLVRLGIWTDPPSYPAPNCKVSQSVRLGDVGLPARCVESRLRQLGYWLVGPDDRFDATADHALRVFQGRWGLPVDGIAGYQTLVKLGIWTPPPVRPEPPCRVTMSVRLGDRNGAARCVESRLVQLGYWLVGPDDHFDGTAVFALRRFQYRSGLYATGVADYWTLLRLGIFHPPPPGCARCAEIRTIGASARGVPIRAYRYGTPGGRVVVVVGSIHGDEQAGHQITGHVQATASVPGGIDLWIIETVNPDGVVRNTRTNFNGVDLNRNFPTNWTRISCTTYPTRCAGNAPGDQPETRAVAAFVAEIRPSVVIWYHGADNAIDAGALSAVANPNVVRTYAAVAAMALRTVPCLPLVLCTGTATQHINRTIAGSSAFVVELATKAAGGLSSTTVARHVGAIFRAVVA